ncbi:hypothetical protein P280DRAFT_547102 [Massarina eburnea CBS 473.64]|uniref:FAD-binding FR-type domain-containing protein n=1 Tax=Massarina eburnea CBS 473.64 TaxID=1395130 RepID=A0A6A6SAM6_9PLEO|nr:hypothetical protein P280DRAFT_547102 [Massarina eburnea CBS 473.64]
MADEGNGLDDVRYEHHLRHRGRSNKYLAKLFWLAILALITVRITQRIYTWWRRRCYRKHSLQAQRMQPTQFSRFYAYIRAFFLLPLPFGLFGITIGRLLALAAYANIIAAFILSVDAPKIISLHFADDVAFRAAWITVTQVPLVYFLATKRGPLQLLSGFSHERINWLHRWVGRILFICATTHMAIMMTSISITELLRSHEKGMSVVRYGLGAYGTLLWIVITSILPLRRWSYRAFYLNHWACTLLFLGIVAKHVPTYARLPIYASFALVAIDKCMSVYRLLWHNITIRTVKRKVLKLRRSSSKQVLAMGHPVKMMPPVIKNGVISSAKESTTIIRLSDVPFTWKPGQHVRLYLPKLGALEIHPFTPATCSDISSSTFPSNNSNDSEFNGLLHTNAEPFANDMVLMVRAHSGLTKRLSDYHSEWLATPCPNASRESSSLTAYVDGPYGNPPTWEDYENIVLLATSTGVSYILSILDHLEQMCFDGKAQLRTQQIHFIWTNQHIERQFEETVIDLIVKHSTLLRESDIKLHVEFHTTCPDSDIQLTSQRMCEFDPFAHLRQPSRKHFVNRRPLRIRNPDNPEDWEDLEYETESEEQEDLKEIEPRISEMDSRESCETYVSSTLIDDDDDQESLFSDLDSTIDEPETSFWNRMPSFRIPSLRSTSPPREPQTCSCALLQQQEQSPHSRPARLPDFITRSYGSRPDISATLKYAIPTEGTVGRSMVAVCSNKGVVESARKCVARMEWEVARGRRKEGVDIFTEGFE